MPGLNPCIKAVVNRVVHDGHEVVGLRRGWAALLHHDPDDPASAAEWFQPLDAGHGAHDRPHRRHVPAHLAHEPEPGQGIRGSGASRRPAWTARARSTSPSTRCGWSEALGIDALIPIGGDDTLSYALRMHEEGVPVIAIPKTMDNDVHGTDYCIGFSTAVTRGVQFIHNLRTSTPARTSGSR